MTNILSLKYGVYGKYILLKHYFYFRSIYMCLKSEPPPKKGGFIGLHGLQSVQYKVAIVGVSRWLSSVG